ncbi:PIN domain-like protein [Laetiporus sulphureus 93-53]|uniref:PIN domain-like protein n=1 Tax=Laetiporus sulphureus 93-53 TaxID=1314785 RepID=A0A165EUG7_9APHY|nr:PIN domain-like protein [Laetiporus sulphureus 93-53]KZT07787.1 PIN domain-like protein [Laetiporus sulphureus 93-53]
MGVKSLWSLLDPVGRPVLLETMEGKAMAIDSSIWIYQFQATMRDKEGRGLVNAHVLGFLRRISKLLFYGIKPVFVFDGGAPALKRATITERKKKKAGAALSHAKVAERLLAAQLRREALNHVQEKSSEDDKGKEKVPRGPVVIDENAVYLEDIDESVPKTPSKEAQGRIAEPTPPSSRKKSRWHDHDPYKLPDMNMDEIVAKATSSHAPDPRLATEDELRAFIEEMRPEDFDVSSPAFRELPTEVQYEIIGDLRLKSRQTSYKRLQNMLRNTKTPLDFSKEQIKNLKQRNSLTQQLLITTDSIGKAHVSIPIRIASERNREYVLIKNEDGEGGWVLGIRDEGTRNKPIEIDHHTNEEEQADSSDMEMEEVAIGSNPLFDPDLREYRRGQALTALASRYTPKKLVPVTTRIQKRAKKSRPLFAPEEGEVRDVNEASDEDEDPAFAAAIQQSLEYEEEANLRHALEASKSESLRFSVSTTVGASSSRVTLDNAKPVTPGRGASSSRLISENDEMTTTAMSDDEGLYVSPSRLETALSIAHTGLRPQRQPHLSSAIQASMFGAPSLLVLSEATSHEQPAPSQTISDSEEDMEEVAVISVDTAPVIHSRSATPMRDEPVADAAQTISVPSPHPAQYSWESEDEDEMEEVLPVATHPSNPETLRERPTHSQILLQRPGGPATPDDGYKSLAHDLPKSVVSPDKDASISEAHGLLSNFSTSRNQNVGLEPSEVATDSENEGSDAWHRSSSPASASRAATAPVESTADGWDAAEEMDPQAEEGEFARFISQVKGRDLDTVRREIDDEIRELHQQRKIAMRDSEDVTQQMVSQIMIMLRLFGIPYITAPMEAEAQCAELLQLGLVDGIITDDSDVFLFGGLRVLKNMFNQSKTVECFLLTDLERELGLDRDKLIRLAYLLGSDYTEGLPGVGPVVAMELLKEFPGQDGLHKFKHWWQKVQSGKDTSDDTGTTFRKRFKKRFKDLYIPDDWPNPAVRDAYYHPTVDESEEPFKWGLPDLDALRDFFNSELGWHASKVDDLLLPIIRKMGKRGQSSTLNKQGNLTSFFDVPLGGNAAPRKRQAYASKRLQQVVSDFRKERARQQSVEASAAERDASFSDKEPEEKPAKRRKTTASKGKSQDRGGKKAARGRGGKTARGRRAKRTSEKRQATLASEGDKDAPNEPHSPPPPLAVNLRPRPTPAYRGSRADSDVSDEDDK